MGEDHTQYGGAKFSIGGIQRSPTVIKFWIRVDMLEGGWLSDIWSGDAAMPDFGKVLMPVKTNCKDGILGNGTAYLYDRHGKMIMRYSIKESFTEMGPVGDPVFRYFCERGEAPKKAPILKR